MGGRSTTLVRAEKTGEGEGVANLATYDDYNQLAKRVNASPEPLFAATSFSAVTFSERPNFVI